MAASAPNINQHVSACPIVSADLARLLMKAFVALDHPRVAAQLTWIIYPSVPFERFAAQSNKRTNAARALELTLAGFFRRALAFVRSIFKSRGSLLDTIAACHLPPSYTAHDKGCLFRTLDLSGNLRPPVNQGAFALNFQFDHCGSKKITTKPHSISANRSWARLLIFVSPEITALPPSSAKRLNQGTSSFGR